MPSQSEVLSPARLVVARTLAKDVGHRQVYVELDGQRIATLLVGETVTRHLAPGPHRLKLDNTLVTKTFQFDAAPGQSVEYRFANRAGRFVLPFLAVMGVAPLFLSVERIDPTNQG